MKKLITFLSAWILAFSAIGQVEFNITPSSTSADPGQTVSVDITVENFVDIVGLEFQVTWDDAVLQFQNIITYDNILCNVNNPTPCFFYSPNPNQGNIGPNTITDLFAAQYLDDLASAYPNTLNDGDKILTVEFLVIGNGGQTSDISFAGNPLVVNSSFQELSVSNGGLVVSDGTFTVNGMGCAGNGTVTFSASDESGSCGDQRVVQVSVDNFEDIEGFGFNLTWDPALVSFDSVGGVYQGNLPGLTNPTGGGVGSFNNNNNTLFVSWQDGNGQTVCDGTVIFEIYFTLVGQGNSDVEFTGNIEVIKNSNLINPILNDGSVNVTGGAGCGGGNTGDITFDAGEVSGETGDQVCVPFTVTNFDQVSSFQYEIFWDETVMTFANVLDGNGQPLPVSTGTPGPTAGNPLNLILPAPPAVGNFGLSNTGNGGIFVAWSNQAGVTVNDNVPVYEVCFDIIGATGSSSDITFGGTIEAANNNGIQDLNLIPGQVNVTGTFNGLELEWDCCEKVEIGSNVCIDIRVVDGFTNIGSMQYGMEWDQTVLDFTGFAFGNGDPLMVANQIGSSLVGFPNDGNAKLLWSNNMANGLSLMPGQSLYQICFDVIGNAGSTSDLDLGALPNANPPFAVEISVRPTDDVIDFLGNTCTTEAANLAALALTATPTNPSCVGSTDGALDLTVTGGAPGYTFAWSNSVNTEDLSGLGAGSYTVTVTDCGGGTAEQTFTISDPAPINVTANITDVTGAGNDGAIDITVSGGAPNYTFAWSNGSTTEDISGLTVGSYTVTVTDSNQCTAEQTFSVATGCLPFTISGNITHETSAGNDGAITVTTTGGTAPYNYSWSPNVGSTATVNNLAAGNYTVTATDANGCTGQQTFTVDAFNCPTVTVTASGTHVTCAGGSDGTATANATGGTAPYNYNWGVNPNTLSAGTYTVTATDADGCSGTATVTINDGITIGVSLVNSNSLTCFNNNTGTITITGTNGTAPYTASWSNGMSGLTISNLAAGSYTPTITDANGCQATGSAITVSQPNDISIVGNPSNTSCNGGSDGSISLNISGGTGGYNVSWSNGASGQTINNLSAGSYTPTVTDANGCTKIGNAITVGQPSALNVVATVTDASCAGNCDGAISLAITGGAGGYSVNWSNGDSGTSVSGLCGGNITATVTDANGCAVSDVYTIIQPEVFTLDFVITNESVVGDDGAVDLIVSPTGSYNYQWSASNDPNFNPITEDINNLSADLYSVTVTDPSTGCFVTGFASITNSLGVQSVVETDITCNGGSDGSIELVTVGDATPYGWVWSGPNNFSAQTESIFNVQAGIYSVTITDANMVTLVQTYTLTEPDSVTMTFTIQDETDFCDGAIDLTPAGGVAPYTYQWSTGATSEDVTGLCDTDDPDDGGYTVTVTDANGCINISNALQIAGESPSVGSIELEHVSCPDATDGSKTVTLIGGNPPFTLACTPLGGNPVTVTSNSHTYTFGSLAAGIYLISGVDASGNQLPATQVEILAPDPIQITNTIITNASAGNCDGAIDITVTGGMLPYTFQWSNGFNSSDPSGLCPGNYDVTIIDSKGCVFVSEEFTVSELIQITGTFTNVTCNGDADGSFCVDVAGGVEPYSYEWTDCNGNVISTEAVACLTGLSGGCYQVMITDMMGFNVGTSGVIVEADVLTTNGISVTPPDLPTCSDGSIGLSVVGGTPIPGNPDDYEFLWKDEGGNDIGTGSSISNLVGGMYFVTITDFNGCTTEVEVDLPSCEIGGSLAINQISCPDECDASIGFTPDSGTGPYFYDWSNGETTSTITDLCAGTYSLTVTDDNGVETFRTIDIVSPASIEVTVETSPGRAEAVVIGGTAPYTYQWDDEITEESFIEELRGGIHVLIVTDSNNCQAVMSQFEVPYGTDCLTARSTISPNEDGFNDVFYVNCVENQPVKVTIYNRWGQEVFQVDEYDNSWAGTGTRGEILAEGGYFYILEYEDPSGAQQVIKGSLSIVR